MLVVLSLVLPRMFPNPEGGFASGANAILVLLGTALIATLVSLYLLARTVRVFREISVTARIAGVGPSIFLVLALVSMLGFLSY